MIAADLNNRRKLLSLIFRSLGIRGLRPSFTSERGLIVCQVQAADSYKASSRVRGVFAEVLDPERAATGAECGGYRDRLIRFIDGRAWPAIVFQSLRIIRGEFDFYLSAESQINGTVTDYAESFESYAEARASAINWIRGCLFETGDLEPGATEDATAQQLSLSLSPARRKREALRWMDEPDRRALLGDNGAQGARDDSQAVEGQETSAGGQQAQNTPSIFGG